MKLFKILMTALLFLLMSLPVQAKLSQAEIRGLSNSSPQARINTIFEIGKGYDTSKVPAIVKKLSDKNSKVRAAAAETLVYFNTSEVIPALIRALNDTNPDVVKYSVYGLDFLRAKSAVPGLRKVLRHKDEKIRASAAVALGKLGDKSGKTVLEKALKSKSYFIRLNASIALRNSGDKSSISALKLLLKDRLEIRCNAARTLWELGDKSGKEIILKECFTQLDHINRFNYSAMLNMTDESDMDLIMEALIQNPTGSSPFTKKYALKALARLKAKSAIPEIIKLMDPDYIYYEWGRSLMALDAADALREIGDKSAVPALQELMDTLSLKLRMTAVRALYEITGESKYMDFILNGLKSDFEATKRESAWILVKINDENSVPYLEEALKKEKEPFTAKALKESIEKISGKKIDFTLPKKVIKKKPEPVLTDEMKKNLPHGRRPPQLIYFRVDDCSTIDGMEILVKTVKAIGEAGGKNVVYNFLVAPYASPDPERVRLYCQYLFDRGSSLNNHSLWHNPEGQQLTAQDLEDQLVDTLGCDKWLRDNIRGLDRIRNNRAGGGGGWNRNKRVYITNEIHRLRSELYNPHIIGNGKEIFCDEYFWHTRPAERGAWILNLARNDFTAPPVYMYKTGDETPICEALIAWNGRFGRWSVEEGVEMLTANFDYFYNHPMRPPLKCTSIHDWEFDITDRPKPGHINQGEILKGFLYDVLVTNKDKYPDTYVVTYHQMIEYLKHGDIKKVVAEGNGQTDPEFGKTVAEKEQKIYDYMRALSKSFIKNWSVIGPFETKNQKGLKKKYPPEKEIALDKTYKSKGKILKWSKQSIPDADMAINFNEVYEMGEEPGVAYAFVKVNSPDKKKAQIRIGSNDGAKVWVNDKVILNKFAVRNIKIDEDIIPVTLEKGSNEILIKVEKSEGKRPHWGFCCRLTDLEGEPLK